MDDILKWNEILEDLSENGNIKEFLSQIQEKIETEKFFFKDQISNILDINQIRAVLYRFLNFLVTKIKANGVIAFYLDEKEGELIFKPYYVITPDKENKSIPSLLNFNVHFDQHGSVLSYVLSERKMVYVREVDPFFLNSQTSQDFYKILPIRSHITIPLLLDHFPVGVIQFYSLYHSIEISDNELLELKQSAHSIAMILKAILLYERIYRNYNTIKKINANLKKELKLAQRIQENLLPKNPPRLQGVQMDFWYKPMEELGGDFFDFIIRREEDGIGFFISDVAGHGVPSALITTMIKSLLNTQRVYLDRPKNLIQRINAALFENNVSDFFVTAFYLYLDLKQKKIVFTSAGHNEAILFRKRQEEFVLLKTKGKFLGIFSENSWEEEECFIQSGDRIILYTDGITEMINHQGEEFGLERFTDLIRLSKNLDTLSAKNFLVNNILNFENTEFLNDDKAFIIIDVL